MEIFKELIASWEGFRWRSHKRGDYLQLRGYRRGGEMYKTGLELGWMSGLGCGFVAGVVFIVIILGLR